VWNRSIGVYVSCRMMKKSIIAMTMMTRASSPMAISVSAAIVNAVTTKMAKGPAHAGTVNDSRSDG
jgi:pectin methylesterase-like acyl-CoA thioesterase